VAPYPETSIASVATRVDYIERSEAVVARGGTILGQGFTRADYVDLFAERARSVTLRSYHLENVHLDTAAMTLIKDGSKIKETNYLVPPEYYDQACVIENGLVRLEDSVNYIMARGFSNYYHWLVQTIPAVDWSLQKLPSSIFALLTGHLATWQAEMLSILDYDNVPRIVLDPSHHYLVPALDYSEFQNGSSSFEISQSAQATYKRLAAVATDSSPAKADIIYIARTDSTNRVAENEAEILRLLEAEGILTVVPGMLSVSQQINLFSKADAVIGLHGAGLTNIVFCRPGTILYELSSTHYLNPCFSRLAQAGGLSYVIDLFDNGSQDIGDPHNRRWVVDLDFVLGRIREIKLRVSSLHSKSVPVVEPVSAIDYLKGKSPSPMEGLRAELPLTSNKKMKGLRSWLPRFFSC
jgi:hypothetical protein